MALSDSAIRIALLTFVLGISSLGCSRGAAQTPIAASPATSQRTDVPPPATAEDAIETPEPVTQVEPTQPVATTPATAQPPRNPFQPPTVTVRTVTQREIQQDDIRLLGIAKRGSEQFAILERSGKLHKAAEGDFVHDWEVTQVRADQATLRRGLEEIKLHLD